MVGQLPPTRDVTQEDRDDLLIPLASGVQELLFAPVSPFTDRPAFVAGPTPETGLAQAVQGVTRLNCRLWASRDKSGYSLRVNQYNGEVCGPYLESIGENPTPGGFPVPFQGGQCVGIDYTAFLATDNDPTGPIGGSVTVTGPVTALSKQTEPSGDPSFPIRLFVRATGANGTVESSGVTTIQSIVNLVSPRLLPINEGTDICGDPPVDVQPPATVTPTSPIVPTVTINLPGVGPTTVNVDIDVDGRPVITAPDIGAEITIAPDLDIDVGGGGGGGDPGDPTDPGDPGTPEGTGAGGEAAGNAPPGTELVGLLVTVAQAPGDANKFSNNPKQPFRGIGYVRMGFPGRLGLDISGGTVISPQFFHAQQRGLTAWAVAANTGFNLTIQPYFRDIET